MLPTIKKYGQGTDFCNVENNVKNLYTAEYR